MKLSLALLLFACASCQSSSSPTPVCEAVAPADLGGVGAGLWGDPAAASVTQYHKNASRDGLYVEPLFTRAAAARLRVDPTFAATTSGQAYAQPLFVDGGPGGADLVIVGTEDNEVTAFDAADGEVVWRIDSSTLGAPANAADLPCGNISPHQGVHGTGAIDLPSRTLFFDALTEPSSKEFHHLIFGVSIDDGSVRVGFPVDVSERFSDFDSSVQGQRGALLIVGGNVYVPYGGMWGDCGHYYGYVVQVPVGDPDDAASWRTRSPQSGIWATGGLASDGTSVFGATGNSFNGVPYGDQESIIRFTPGPAVADEFWPNEWMSLDTGDIDLGGSGPVLFDGAGGKRVLAFGKDTNAYLLDGGQLGGLNGQLTRAQMTRGPIIQAAAVWPASDGPRVVIKGTGTHCPTGESGGLTAIAISDSQLTTVWCADQVGRGSPIVTTTDGHSEAIVWAVGAENDNRLHGFDAETGAELFAGGCDGDQLGTVRALSTPIVAKGRLYVAADQRVYAFSP